jgi:lanosterol synthase
MAKMRPNAKVNGNGKVNVNATATATASNHTKSSATSTRKAKLSDRTDYMRWRMLDERGRQTWHYLEDDEAANEWPQSTADKYYLGLPTVWNYAFVDTLPC